uniref:Uncharacterized protein n=1 Tax=Amphilophus citrinellus TaxID=61819 RepID=A0A3Q0R0I5_AMPCI
MFNVITVRCLKCYHDFAQGKMPSPQIKRKKTSTVPPKKDFTYLMNVTYESKLAIETGYDDRNVWLKWVKYTAETTAKSDCVASPYHLSLKSDPEGLLCTVKLFKQTSAPKPGTCNTLNYLYPKVKRANIPPSVVLVTPNVSCEGLPVNGRRGRFSLPVQLLGHYILQTQGTSQLKGKQKPVFK